MKTVRLGVIGLGARGRFIVRDPLVPLAKEGVLEIVALCDYYDDRVKEQADFVEEHTGKRPFCTSDYKEVLKQDIEAVLILSAWESHVEIATAAMRAGIHVGMEVGGGYSVEDCYRLVRTYEETGIHCMLLENCCYGRRELMALNMVRQGVFGDIVHCVGGYNHDLREEIADGEKNRHYRLRNYLERNCENYPTHELGPIMAVLNINHGNRMIALNSVASCSKGVETFIRDKRPDSALVGEHFNQGDVVTTIIKCADGQTITMTLDTTLPRMYSRAFTVRGTKGMYCEDGDYIHMDGDDEFNDVVKVAGNAEKYSDQYEHPLWKEYKNNPTGGHGGIDWLVYNAFVKSVADGTTPPIDTYDTATLLAISPLSEASVAMGGAPVAIPDFTGGRWVLRKENPDHVGGEYELF
ncbi:MAG: Gfo/Idh/MocA family oxidoreductase [Clostridiales bacterium]|nr:Gfo/Idh/MocA family oxidoreductase [Candidatus Coliplasma caballi]